MTAARVVGMMTVRDEEDILAEGKAHPSDAEHHGQRACDEHQDASHGERSPDILQEVAGRHEQAQHQEERHLADPLEGLVEVQDIVERTPQAVADGDADKIDGEEAAAADERHS